MAIAALAALIFGAMTAHGQAFRIGASFSPKACGVSAQVDAGKVSTEYRLEADLENVIGGVTTYPGVRASCYVEYTIARWQIRPDLGLYLFSGPGALLGYVEDGKYGRGVAAALGVIGGAGFSFSTPFTITVSLSGHVGGHLTFSGTHENTLRPYYAGMVGTIMPEVGIRYRFR